MNNNGPLTASDEVILRAAILLGYVPNDAFRTYSTPEEYLQARDSATVARAMDSAIRMMDDEANYPELMSALDNPNASLYWPEDEKLWEEALAYLRDKYETYGVFDIRADDILIDPESLRIFMAALKLTGKHGSNPEDWMNEIQNIQTSMGINEDELFLTLLDEQMLELLEDFARERDLEVNAGGLARYIEENIGLNAFLADVVNAYALAAIAYANSVSRAQNGSRKSPRQRFVERPMNTKGKIPWDSWSNYEKVTVNGQEYAKVGNRLYSKHAVDRMQPSGNRFGPNIVQAGGDYGRSIAPQYVEDVINSSRPVYQPESGNYAYSSGSVKVILNPEGAVVTIMTYMK